MIFRNYTKVLETKIADEERHPSASYSHPSLQNLAMKKAVSSFNYFLPFSDSIFISSDDPNLFLKQLGSFALTCFTLTSKQYQNPSDPNNPTKVTRRISYQKLIEENWYPTVFRGGIAIGEAEVIELSGIVSNKPKKITNLAGEAVVKAVSLEQKVKGPRIVFEKDLYDKLDPSTKIYTSETEIKDIYELLWPCFIYNLEEGYVYMAIGEFYRLFLPALNLWKAYNHTPFSEHYFKFVELVVSGTLKVFDALEHKDRAVEQVTELILTHGFVHKMKHILEQYIR